MLQDACVLRSGSHRGKRQRRAREQGTLWLEMGYHRASLYLLRRTSVPVQEFDTLFAGRM
jgi:hypothetical protein